ncbi:uncharacterized protein PAN0_001d0474 [Moesziomyces antarcticus]|uniref:Mitochondrial K+-H+ exchange-related-domain-containing protein n=1 Tax=Pseudozyma antarctica TaxID=84753 RepID=A0A5C3FGH7_PSEA2|nr:uncharacterized protein PAN0_001d0474 [Moesziomyces antarcticus]GAK62275.1 conserved hypothetical protein [Moesziomyces antarcticus]SPO42815.1 uncharacterized protein PSANT_00498 [Moesziomyces antarcticus]
MRLIAVPLARARPSSHPISTFVAQTASRAAEKAAAAAAAKQQNDASKPPLSTRLLNKASAFWIDLGRTDQTSTFDWKRRTYVLGERLMDRIEYQEWALKGIDPAMGPLRHESKAKQADVAAADTGIPKLDHIPLLYPPSLLEPQRLLKSLKNLTDHRTPHHYRRFWYCVVGMPITIPFALVPVVPNLPFFYLVYRAFSHWKAYKSSQYLSTLISQDRVQPTESKELDEIFAQTSPPPPTETSEASDKPQDAVVPKVQDDRMLFLPHHIPMLMERMEFPEWVRADLRRARLQVEKSAAENKLEELESNAEHEHPENKK